LVASRFVSDTTRAHLQDLLRDSSDGYLAGIATWADSVKYTKWGQFSRTFHFIDAKDNPPESCDVDFDRDCKASGCVVSALANYTQQLLDPSLSGFDRAVAAKFVVHFVGDIHQPLHDENVARGGNGIPVLWEGHKYNLHHVWDSSIAEKWLGGRRGTPYEQADKWAEQLVEDITSGSYAEVKEQWLEGVDLKDPINTAMVWVRESNAYICSTVLPEGPDAIRGQELSGPYYDKAGPVIAIQVARGGYRMAAWLDNIIESYVAESLTTPTTEEL
jgi:hypothetical protein